MSPLSLQGFRRRLDAWEAGSSNTVWPLTNYVRSIYFHPEWQNTLVYLQSSIQTKITLGFGPLGILGKKYR